MTLSDELRETWRLRRYMLYRAVLTLQAMHSRSILGILWEPLLVIITSFVLAAVWSVVMGDGDFKSYFAYICIGVGIWGCVSKSVLKGASYIHKYSHSIANSRYPLLSYVIVEILLCAMIFIAVLPFLVGIGFFFNGFSITALLTSLFGTLLMFLAGVGFGVLVGSITSFFPDLREIIAAIMRISFLVTPIIWRPERLGEHVSYLIFNPFHPFIELIRTPLLGNEVSLKIILLAVGITTFLLVGSLLALKYLNDTIRFRVV